MRELKRSVSLSLAENHHLGCTWPPASDAVLYSFSRTRFYFLKTKGLLHLLGSEFWHDSCFVTCRLLNRSCGFEQSVRAVSTRYTVMKNKIIGSLAVLTLALVGMLSVNVQAQTTEEGKGPSEQPSAPMEIGQPQSAPVPPAGQPGQAGPPPRPGQPQPGPPPQI